MIPEALAEAILLAVIILAAGFGFGVYAIAKLAIQGKSIMFEKREE